MSGKVSIRWSEQVERIKQIEFDTAEEASTVAGALGQLVAKKMESDARAAKIAHELQIDLLRETLKPDVQYPLVFKVNNNTRIQTRGSLISGGDVTDLQSQALLEAARNGAQGYEIEVRRRL